MSLYFWRFGRRVRVPSHPPFSRWVLGRVVLRYEYIFPGTSTPSLGLFLRTYPFWVHERTLLRESKHEFSLVVGTYFYLGYMNLHLVVFVSFREYTLGSTNERKNLLYFFFGNEKMNVPFVEVRTYFAALLELVEVVVLIRNILYGCTRVPAV